MAILIITQLRYILSNSFNESQNPIVFIEAATALAKAKTMPTDAPNSIKIHKYYAINSKTNSF